MFELKDEWQKYFQVTNNQDFVKCFEDEHWLQRLSYLADIFHHMNQLSKSLQGPRENTLISSDKIHKQSEFVNKEKCYKRKF